MDNNPTHINIQDLDIVHYMLHEDHKLRLFNLGTTNNLQTIKLNATFDELVAKNIETLL
jgi:hypothetical protein